MAAEGPDRLPSGPSALRPLKPHRGLLWSPNWQQRSPCKPGIAQMQFLAQGDRGGWFLAARRNPWKTPYWLSKKTFPEYMRPKITGRCQQGLEMKWGRRIIRNSSTLTKSAIRTQLPWRGLSHGQGLASVARGDRTLFSEESSIWNRWA